MPTCLFATGLLITYILTMAIMWHYGPSPCLGPFALILLAIAARQIVAWRLSRHLRN